ncbi:MAG: Asp/Glu racemase [Geminicoccaceae bacterium]|nr:Asp/Glu racemase [Geminicoccaceae bacterium]
MTTQLAERVDLEHLPFQLDQGIGERASIGVIVLATDQTLEHEFRVLLKVPGVAFYESRISNENAITRENLQAMEGRIGAAAGLILPGVPLDVVAFGCTSASMVIGEERVFELIKEARPEVACTTPITAALAGLRAMRARRIALLTPYRADINHFIREYIEARGFEVPVMGSFNEEDDRRAARIDLPSIRQAGVDLLQRPGVDALFVSCTSLRLAEVIGEIEAETGKPATSSNHALAWHCLRLAGIDDRSPEHGSLYQMDLA